MNLQAKTEILSEQRNRFVSDGVASVTPLYVESAKGAIIKDVDGREYIDFAGGIAVMNIGHSHPKVVAAIKDQAEKFTHTCFMVNPYESVVALAEKLCLLTPGDFAKKAVFLNCGAEAVENAIAALPEDLRTAIILRELEGMSYEEIAQTMECPVGTVRSRIFRARDAINKKIGSLTR